MAVSTCNLSDEVRRVYRGMMVAVPAGRRLPFARSGAAELAAAPRGLTRRADLSVCQRHPRGPKKPAPRRTKDKRRQQVAASRLMAGRQNKQSSPRKDWFRRA